MMNELSRTCELCTLTGGELLWQNALCRIVSVGNLDYPGFCRVILNRHAAEMSDLPSAEQQELMRVVFVVEAVVRDVLKPDKINLASLGNMVPHVHWHVIPRWRKDSCFPNPIWAPAQRTSTVIPVADGLALVRQLATELASRLGEPSMTENGGQS